MRLEQERLAGRRSCDGGIAWTVAITPADVHDGRMLGAVLRENPGIMRMAADVGPLQGQWSP